VPDAGDPAAAVGADVQRGELADGVLVAYLQRGVLAGVLEVLGDGPDGGELEDAVFLPMVVRPSRTACGPTLEPAPILTLGPMTA
jgi:hypothetical protein